MIILKRKILPPRINPTKLVLRHRLFEPLEQVDEPLIVISAPSGYGKTTLACQWISHNNLKCGWLSLDEYDNDPTRFWIYCLHALDQAKLSIQEKQQQKLISLLNDYSINVFIEHLIYELTQIYETKNKLEDHFVAERCTLAESHVLILDEFDAIHNTKLLDSINYFIEYLPDFIKIVIICKSANLDKKLNSKKYRGPISHIKSDSLAFTYDETRALFKTIKSHHTTDEEVAWLTNRTEGWIAGLILNASFSEPSFYKNNVSNENTHTTPTRLTSQNHSHQHLLERIINRLPGDTKQFLASTCIVAQFNYPLAHELTQDPECKKHIKFLIENNLFITILNHQNVHDHHDNWFRYHALFLETLRNLIQFNSPEELPTLHQKAGKWLESHDFLSEALDHYLKLNDLSLAINLVAKKGHSLFNQGLSETTKTWLGKLPEDQINKHASLLCLKAKLWLLPNTENHSLSEKYLIKAEKLIQDTSTKKSTDTETLEEIQKIRTAISVISGKFNNLTNANKKTQNNNEIISHDPISLLLLGLEKLNYGNSNEIKILLIQAIKQAKAEKNWLFFHLNTGLLLSLHFLLGEPKQLISTFKKTEEYSLKNNLDAENRSFLYIPIILYYTESLKTKKSELYLRKLNSLKSHDTLFSYWTNLFKSLIKPYELFLKKSYMESLNLINEITDTR